MRLSDWRARAPFRESLAPRVVEVIESVVTTLGGEADPACWIVWGDDPAARFVVFVPSAAGLLQVPVRVNVPQEGPRASGKLVRWNRLSVGELAVEMADRHRLLSFQVEGQVLKGSDDDADAIAAFALELFAAIDGRPFTPPVRSRAGRARGAARPTAGAGRAGTKATGTKATGTKATGTKPAGTKATLALPEPRGQRT